MILREIKSTKKKKIDSRPKETPSCAGKLGFKFRQKQKKLCMSALHRQERFFSKLLDQLYQRKHRDAFCVNSSEVVTINLATL